LPSSPDDDAALLAYGSALATAVDAVISDWVERCVLAVCAARNHLVDDALRANAVAAGQECRRVVVPELTELLASDPDAQTDTPLSILRRAVRFPTAVLSDAGIEPSRRDEFDQRMDPDDFYGLSPASFADVDPSLTEPGIVWGAAKAHVHLARHRPSG
jgi:hypothetical protein